MDNIIVALFENLFILISNVIDFILTPLNAIIDNFFPNVATAINAFVSMTDNFFNSGFIWLLHFVPPITKTMLLLWITFEVSYYGIIWSYTLFIKVYNLIQKIKFW